MKKLLALLCTLALIMGLAVTPVLADGGTPLKIMIPAFSTLVNSAIRVL